MTDKSYVEKRMAEADEAMKELLVVYAEVFLKTASEKIEEIRLYGDSKYAMLLYDMGQIIQEIKDKGFAYQDGNVMVPHHRVEEIEQFFQKKRFGENNSVGSFGRPSPEIELQNMAWKIKYLSWMIKMTANIIEKADYEKTADREKCYDCFRFLVYLTEYKLFSDEGVMNDISELQMLWPYQYVSDLVV